MSVRHNEGYLFLPKRAIGGRSGAKTAAARVSALTADAIGHFWEESIEAAREVEVDLPEGFVARKLRASFVTAMRKGRADFEDLQGYIGHAPASILSEHYDRARR